MARAIALRALVALGLSGASFHEPFHVADRQQFTAVTERSGKAGPGGAANLPWSDRQPNRVLHSRIGPYLDQRGFAAPGRVPPGHG